VIHVIVICVEQGTVLGHAAGVVAAKVFGCVEQRGSRNLVNGCLKSWVVGVINLGEVLG